MQGGSHFPCTSSCMCVGVPIDVFLLFQLQFQCSVVVDGVSLRSVAELGSAEGFFVDCGGMRRLWPR